MDSHTLHRGPGTWVYFVAGVLFGIVITRGEVISWFRIQEMFRFQAFHMYGIIGSALVVAAGSVAILKRYRIAALDGELGRRAMHLHLQMSYARVIQHRQKWRQMSGAAETVAQVVEG